MVATPAVVWSAQWGYAMSVSHPHLRQSRATCRRGRYEQLTKYQTISIFRYNIYYLLYISKNPNVYLELYIVILIICNLTCKKNNHPDMWQRQFVRDKLHMKLKKRYKMATTSWCCQLLRRVSQCLVTSQHLQSLLHRILVKSLTFYNWKHQAYCAHVGTRVKAHVEGWRCTMFVVCDLNTRPGDSCCCSRPWVRIFHILFILNFEVRERQWFLQHFVPSFKWKWE